MLRLRLAIGAVAWWLFLFYNIERINEPINIASFVYVLAPLSASVLMLMPRFFKRWRLAFWIMSTLVVYFAVKVWLRYELFGTSLPLTVTEVASLVITLLLVGQLANVVSDFEETIANLTIRQIGLPPRLYDTVDVEELYREVKRSRRFQHNLALLVVNPKIDPKHIDVSKTLLEIQKTMINRYIKARVAKLLSEELRDCDLVAQHGSGFAIVLPETRSDEAKRIAQLLAKHSKETLGVELEVGMASFPETALTLGGLLDAATDNLLTGQEAEGGGDGQPQAVTEPQQEALTVHK